MDAALELSELRARLAEAEETLRAIREGEVDALLVVDGNSERVYTLRSADAPYRALVEQMHEGAVSLNLAGDIVYSNRRFAELVGVGLQNVIGSSIDDYVEPAGQAELKALLEDGTGSLRTRLRIPSPPGVVEAHISVSQATMDDVVCRTLIVSDLSTLTRVQRESRSKDEFLAMLAHELRNPLGAIANAVEILHLAQRLEPSALHARDVISRQVRHMSRLVDDLLDVGRVMTGKIELARRPLLLGDAVRSAVAALASNHSLQARIEIQAEPAWVRADAIRLEQIVGNLVSNAIKFTPANRPIRVSVRNEGATAVLRVSDEGSGIGPDLLPHIFDLFVQGDDTRDRTNGGLGIGLTLVRQLVELHGGTIEASSAGAGAGATFTVRLPAVAAVEGGPVEGRGVVPARPAKRVLLVDDHADAREMCGMILRAAGHEVFEAPDGPAALAAFGQVRPAFAIIDIGLPGMDGYELAGRIRREPGGRDVKLIALTGYGFPEDRERSAAAGFDRHLVKPAPPDELRRALD
jgi:PAS domain S-box-containing protein